MNRVPTIAGWIVALTILFVFYQDAPPASCRDGWESPSIGRQGACSHHGGVERHEGRTFLAFALGAAAGIFTRFKLAAIIERRRKRIFIRNLVPPDENTTTEGVLYYAMFCEKPVEFLYKGKKDFVPALRVVTPKYFTSYGHPRSKQRTECIVGRCHTRNANRTFALNRITRLKLH